MTRKVTVAEKVLSENDRLAADLRERFARLGIFCINLVSSPGSGKTSLLERTISALGEEIKLAMIAGDVQTENDADRLRRAGARMVRPITTGGACHLDARMVAKSVDQLDLEEIELLFIENVGNLVCPSSYDLGEDLKVVLMSTTEGDDKPLKYPGMFRRSSVMVINKIDMLELCDFDLDTAVRNARQINGNLTFLTLSCRSGVGLEDWYGWLRNAVEQKQLQRLGS